MISNTVKFYSYLALLIPSIICLIFVLYHLLFDRKLRHSLHNHVIILILGIDLIYETTVFPWMLYDAYHEGEWAKSFVFCQIWAFIDWGFYITHTILFAWAAMERHILIFHDGWVSSWRKRLFIHYVPTGALLFYCIVFYVIVYFFPPCDNLICNSSCLFDRYSFFIYETIAHQIIPVWIIILFSALLFLRIVWRKHRVHQAMRWRRYRKLTIQLLSISLLYTLFYFPFTLGTTIYLSGVATEALTAFQPYAIYLIYMFMLLYPFACALALPELRSKLVHIRVFPS